MSYRKRSRKGTPPGISNEIWQSWQERFRATRRDLQTAMHYEAKDYTATRQREPGQSS